jgi:hypothetical protein
VIFEEVAFIAYHFNWELESILDLEHAERQLYAGQISRLNERANGELTRA